MTPEERAAFLTGAKTLILGSRVAIRVRPERIAGWDHSKLGGIY
jgi:hypothetical protein